MSQTSSFNIKIEDDRKNSSTKTLSIAYCNEIKTTKKNYFHYEGHALFSRNKSYYPPKGELVSKFCATTIYANKKKKREDQ